MTLSISVSAFTCTPLYPAALTKISSENATEKLPSESEKVFALPEIINAVMTGASVEASITLPVTWANTGEQMTSRKIIMVYLIYYCN